jgi:hypothetical protein
VPGLSPDIQDAISDYELLDVVDRTPWIVDSLTLFDFEVGRAGDGPIQPVTLAGGEQLEPIAGDATGGCFLLVGMGTSRPVLYVGSEGEGGLIAHSLREALALVVGVSSLHDATAFPLEQDDGRALHDYLARADDEICQDWPELDAARERLRKALGLQPVDDELLRSFHTAAADFSFRPLIEWGDPFRPMLAWLEDAELAQHPMVGEPPDHRHPRRSVLTSRCRDNLACSDQTGPQRYGQSYRDRVDGHYAGLPPPIRTATRILHPRLRILAPR